MTDLAYLRNAYVDTFSASVLEVSSPSDPTDTGAKVGIRLDSTHFYPTGGGQPHDTGTIDGRTVVDVRKEGVDVWHFVEVSPGMPLPVAGAIANCTINWERRHQLMRTHTALHVLCGVIWQRWQVPVTGGNMEPLSARMDFAFDPLPEGFAAEIEALVNAELVADRPIEVSFLPHAAAQADPELIRTKVNLIPTTVEHIRVVDIVGLDKQADGGTHVRSTAEVGRIVVEKTESKGKGNKRLRVRIENTP